jgi:Tol biopolymer transport system component
LLPVVLCAAELTGLKPVSPQSAYCIAPQWSPDGRLYCSTPKYTEILEINLENGALRSVAAGMGAGFKFAFASSGSIFYKKVVDSGRELWKVDTEGQQTWIASDSELGLPAFYKGAIRVRYAEGTFSYTGAGDTLHTSAEGWVYQDGGSIFRYREGKQPQRISPKGQECCLPVQSPDGERVVYENLTGGLVYVNLESGASYPLGPGNNVCWSPDGSFFLFDRTLDDGHRLLSGDIYFILRDSGTAQNLTENFDRIAGHPAISPGGDRIAFEANGSIWMGDLVR